jgi:hypothetical protein
LPANLPRMVSSAGEGSGLAWSVYTLVEIIEHDGKFSRHAAIDVSKDVLESKAHMLRLGAATAVGVLIVILLTKRRHRSSLSAGQGTSKGNGQRLSD